MNHEACQAHGSLIFWIRNWAGTWSFQASRETMVQMGLMHGSLKALTTPKTNGPDQPYLRLLSMQTLAVGLGAEFKVWPWLWPISEQCCRYVVPRVVASCLDTADWRSLDY